MALGERIADFITRKIGSWTSAHLHSFMFIAWFYEKWSINLLTLIVSLEAIYLSIFILIVTNEHHEMTVNHGKN